MTTTQQSATREEGGRRRDMAVKAREVRPAKHGECRRVKEEEGRRGGAGVIKIGGPLKL